MSGKYNMGEQNEQVINSEWCSVLKLSRWIKRFTLAFVEKWMDDEVDSSHLGLLSVGGEQRRLSGSDLPGSTRGGGHTEFSVWSEGPRRREEEEEEEEERQGGMEETLFC